MNYEISKEPINTQAVIDKVVQREAGAITTFIGTVRELTHGKKTLISFMRPMNQWQSKSSNRSGGKLRKNGKAQK